MRWKVLTSLQPKAFGGCCRWGSGGEHPTMQRFCEFCAVQFPYRHSAEWFYCLRQGNKTKRKFPFQLCVSLSAVLTPGPPWTTLLLGSPFQLWSNFNSWCTRILQMAASFLKHQWGFFGLQARTSLSERSFSFPPNTKMT